MSSRSILANYVGSMFGVALSKGLRFLGVIYCVRAVGDYTWGQTVSAIALVSFLHLVVDQGLSASPLLFRLRDRAADARLLRMISGYRLASALVLIGVLHLIHRALVPLDALALTYALVLIPRALSVDWWFQRREMYQVTTYIATVRSLAFFAMVALLVRPGAGAATLLYVEIGSEIAALAFARLAMRYARDAGPEAGTSPPDFGLWDVVRFSLPFVLIAFLNNIQASLDVLVVRFFAGNEATAQYDMGLRISLLYFFVGATLVQILRPKLTRLHQAGDMERLGSVLNTASLHLTLASGILLVPSLYFAKPLMLFLYGRDIGLASFVFQWGAVWVGTSFLSMITADTLLSLGRRKRYLWGALACAATSVGANLVLVRFFSGYGAIFAKIAAELVFLCLAIRFLPRDVMTRYRSGVLLQLGTLAALVALFLASRALGIPLLGLGISLGLIAWIAWSRDAFSRDMLKFLREN